MAPAEARGRVRPGAGGGGMRAGAARPRRRMRGQAAAAPCGGGTPAGAAGRGEPARAAAPCRRPGEGFFFHFQICRSIMLNPFLENLLLYNFSYNFRSLSSWLECCEAFPAPHPFLFALSFLHCRGLSFFSVLEEQMSVLVLFIKNREKDEQRWLKEKQEQRERDEEREKQSIFFCAKISLVPVGVFDRY